MTAKIHLEEKMEEAEEYPKMKGKAEDANQFLEARIPWLIAHSSY